MTAPQRKLGALWGALRALAALDDADLVRWFSTSMNAWGQTPRASGLRVDPHARRDQTERTRRAHPPNPHICRDRVLISESRPSSRVMEKPIK
jgi:hypothetical protein